MQSSIPDSLSVGDLVRYYREGWRVGHVAEITNKHVIVTPIGPQRKRHRKLTFVATELEKAD